MIKEQIGNLIYQAKQGKFDVIGHGVNCSHAWNSGIAKQIKMEIPEAFAVDLETPADDQTKLGTISHTEISVPTVVNLYTQFKYGKDQGVLADYDAIEKALIALKDKFKGKKIAIPKIGAGRARGDWSIIKPIIEKVFCDDEDDLTIITFDQDVHQNQKTQHNSLHTKKSLPQPKLHSRYTVTYQTMNTNLHPRGKRKCKVCDTKKSVKEMISELHGVWTCADVCHAKMFDMVQANHNNLQSTTAVNNLDPTHVLSQPTQVTLND